MTEFLITCQMCYIGGVTPWKCLLPASRFLFLSDSVLYESNVEQLFLMTSLPGWGTVFVPLEIKDDDWSEQTLIQKHKQGIPRQPWLCPPSCPSLRQVMPGFLGCRSFTWSRREAHNHVTNGNCSRAASGVLALLPVWLCGRLLIG